MRGVAKILLMDDEPGLRAVGRDALQRRGSCVREAATGAEGLACAQAEEFDLIVLDVGLPDQNGFSVCREFRQRGNHTPVIMLTARTGVHDRVKGLDAGADDYLAKPFARPELEARIRAALRRTQTQADDQPSDVVMVGSLMVDEVRRVAEVAGHDAKLTQREFDVLLCLARRFDATVPRYVLLDEAWDGDTSLRSNVVDVIISRLRSKLDELAADVVVSTVRGIGFRLTLAPSEP